jgi:Flp pilus assembly protein TadB
MKKIAVLILVLAILGLNLSYAAQTSVATKNVEKHNVVKSNILNKIVVKIQDTKEKIKTGIDNLKKQLGGSLHTALLLMVVGIIMILVGSILGIGIVWEIGALFFLIGAVLLLLYLL